MELLKSLYETAHNLHHAYCIEGDHESVYDSLCEFCDTKMGVATKGNPDFWSAKFETFAIGDGDFIKMHHTRKNVGGRQVFVISTRFMTHEAQNSLLKVFEEPTANTHFFIIAPTAEIFLPTLRSRLHIIKANGAAPPTGQAGPFDKNMVAAPGLIDNSSFDVESFLQSNHKGRMEMLSEIIEEKDKGQAIEFLNSIEAHLKDDAKANKESLKQIIELRSYFYDRAPSIKMILEHIVLTV